MKAMCKYELAAAAGVSLETFRRWLKTDKAFLEANNISPSAKILPPKVVKYLCDKYCIDIGDEAIRRFIAKESGL